MLQMSQCNILYQKDSPDYRKNKLAKKLHIPASDIGEVRIVKKSLDARKKPEIYVTYTLWFTVEDEKKCWGKTGRTKIFPR